MTFFAELSVSHPDLPLDAALSGAGETDVRLVYATTAGERLLFVRAAGDRTGFEAAVAADPTVGDPESVADLDGESVYRLRLATDLDLVPRRCAELGTHTLGARDRDGRWLVRLQFLSHEAMGAFGEHARERGVDLRVRRVVPADRVGDAVSFGMTADQRSVLVTAADAGYFDVPRRATQRDLAARLDVSPSAVSQRLRRATAHLVANALDDADGPSPDLSGG